MKSISFLAVLLILAHLPAAADNFVNGQAADVVLGQSDFDSDTNFYQPSRIRGAVGVAMDPATGKVFVANAADISRILRYSSLAASRSSSDPEAVLGQPNFNSTGPSLSRTRLSGPSQLHIDARGRLWVADRANNRVLCYFSAATRATGAEADFVFGQVSFTNGGSGAGNAGMNGPEGVWVDDDDTLWVADTGNNRILRFDNVTSKFNGNAADAVLGQSNFATTSSGLTDSKMDTPRGVCVDPAGTLWVTDSENNRVLRFDNATGKSNGDPADGVLGQPDFVSSTSSLSQTGMSRPYYPVVDAGGTLWVTDFSNHRSLGFDEAAGLANGSSATTVLGQPDFVTTSTALDARTTSLTTGIGLGPSGSLFIADSGNSRVLRFSPIPTQPVATNTALLALKAQLLSKAKKLKKKAKAAKKKGKAAKAKKLKAKAKKLVKRANSL